MTRQDAVAAVILTASLATWAAMCSQPAKAADTVPFVVALDRAPVDVPVAFAKDASTVIQCESRWRADAISPTDDWGLFQLNRRWQSQRVRAMGYEWADVIDPAINTRIAVAIWESWGQSWEAWSCKP